MTELTEDVRDGRLDALTRWASGVLQRDVGTARPVSVDASFRRYFRFDLGERTLIAMDAPPERENSRAFVQVDRLLAGAGVHVPVIEAVDLDQGFMLLSDLGDRTYLGALNERTADTLFADALAALVRIQADADAGSLPPYDEVLLRRELTLFPDWYLQRHLGVTLPDPIAADLAALFDLLVEHALAQPCVFVHRDFMPRNLMICEPNPGVIDFQDAVRGPVSYDPICLFKDAFISWPDERVETWLRQYWQMAADAGVPVPARAEDFLRDCDLMGTHRHLKVIGIFARICYRDGKPKYLQDVPRFFRYLRTVAARRPELAPLHRVLAHIGEGAARQGATHP